MDLWKKQKQQRQPYSDNRIGGKRVIKYSLVQSSKITYSLVAIDQPRAYGFLLCSAQKNPSTTVRLLFRWKRT